MPIDLSKYGTVEPVKPSVDLSKYGTVVKESPSVKGRTVHNDSAGGPPKGYQQPGAPTGTGAFVSGFEQMGRGAKRFLQGAEAGGDPAGSIPELRKRLSKQDYEKMVGGASDMARGAATASAPIALPLAAPAIAAAPLASALGVAGGVAAQQGTERGLKALGVKDGYAQAAGDVMGLVGGWAATKAAGPIREAAGEAKTAVVDRLERVDPNTAFTKAVKPASTNVHFDEVLNRALPELKVTEAELGRPIAGVDDALEATKLAKQRVWKQYEAQAGPAKEMGSRVDGRPIAAAMRASVPAKVRAQNPGAADAVDRVAATYERDLSVQEAEQFLMESNAELEAFHAKYPPQQRSAVARSPEVAHTVAEAEKLREQLYRTLDEGTGAVAEVKKRYGALSNLERELWRRKNVAARQAPESLSEQISRWQALGKTAKGVYKIVTMDPSGVGDIAQAVAGRKAAKYVKDLNSTDSLVRRGMEYFEGSPGEIPAPVPPNIKGLLEPGAFRMPPPPDPSGIHVTTGAPEQRNPGYWTPPMPKGLPAPALVTPPPADQSGIHITTGPPLQAPPSRQIEAGPTMMPPNADEGRFGMPLDTVLAIDPLTGKPYYTTQPKYMPPPGQ